MFKKLKEKIKEIYETEYEFSIYIPLEYVILTILLILWGLWILLR